MNIVILNSNPRPAGRRHLRAFPERAMQALSRRAFLAGSLAFGILALAGCARPQAGNPEDAPQAAPQTEARETEADSEPSGEEAINTDVTENPMQILVNINGSDFTATVDSGAAGQDLLARLPLTLPMEELHGNEKYCYTSQAFGGEEQVPATIQAGDLMVFSGDCLVLFYETFSNGGWAYQRVGAIDDATGLAEACGAGTATVTFAKIE